MLRAHLNLLRDTGAAGPDTPLSDKDDPSAPAPTAPALLLDQRGGRLSGRGARDILRHTFGTRLVREGYDIVLVAELMGHARLETTRAYTLPTHADREAAINGLPTDR